MQVYSCREPFKCKSKNTQFRKAVSVVSSFVGNPVYKTLAWEPSAAQVTKSFSRHLHALEQFYRETDFFLLETQSTYVESQNQAKNIPVGLPSCIIKVCGKSVPGFLIYDRTNKQTDRQREITTLYI